MAAKKFSYHIIYQVVPGMPEGNWVRPQNVPFPSVWRRFEGSKPFPNGVKPRFRVQDFTEDLMDDVLNNMRNNFLKDEPLCDAINFCEDEKAVDEMVHMWRDYTKHKLVLVCLLENKEELGDDSLPLLAGCNMTGILEPNSPSEKMASEKGQQIFDFLETVLSPVDCFKKYGVSELMYALGLSVDRRFRGQGIGLEILKARFDMGRALGLKLTMTVFTATASQILAERTGFETIYEIAYEDYTVNGEIIFKNIKTPTVKVMAAKIV